MSRDTNWSNQLTGAEAAPVARAVGRYRWRICALLLMATTINYIDRQVLGVLAPHLQTQLGWSEIEYGNIVTAFQAAYAVGLLCAGAIIDRIGTRIGHGVNRPRPSAWRPVKPVSSKRTKSDVSR